MPAARRIREMLDARGIRYEIIPHKPAHTAQTLAEAEHVPSIEHAKSVVVRVGDRLALFVIPACYDLDFGAVADQLGEAVALAEESEFADRFPDCQLGAIPPLGSLYGLETYVDETLAREPVITFPAGVFRESIRMSYADFEQLIHPTVGRYHEERPQ